MIDIQLIPCKEAKSTLSDFHTGDTVQLPNVITTGIKARSTDPWLIINPQAYRILFQEYEMVLKNRVAVINLRNAALSCFSEDTKAVLCKCTLEVRRP